MFVHLYPLSHAVDLAGDRSLGSSHGRREKFRSDVVVVRVDSDRWVCANF